MTTDRPESLPPQLEAYLDGLLEGPEREACEALLARHPEAQTATALQARIDESLRRLFAAPLPTASPCSEPAATISAGQTVTSPIRSARSPLGDRRTWLLLAATAATLAGVLLLWPPRWRKSQEPFFAAQPLVDVYRQTVARGFKPYYECHDPERFAFTFATRQGVPLRLAPLPAGCQMLGLSYSGGLSRHTTAMLCHVDQQPVIVFVDRLEADLPLARQRHDSQLSVLRKEYRGLVLYEVTPFADARIMDFLVLPSADKPTP